MHKKLARFKRTTSLLSARDFEINFHSLSLWLLSCHWGWTLLCKQQTSSLPNNQLELELHIDFISSFIFHQLNPRQVCEGNWSQSQSAGTGLPVHGRTTYRDNHCHLKALHRDLWSNISQSALTPSGSVLSTRVCFKGLQVICKVHSEDQSRKRSRIYVTDVLAS